jgi:hypothetical protein
MTEWEMRAEQRRMLGHGALIMLVAFAAGIGLLVSLLGGIELIPGHIVAVPIFGATDGWRIAHLGGLTNGMLVWLVALCLPVLQGGAKFTRTLGWMLIGTGWANTLFYWAALLSPNEALSFGPNRFGAANWASIVGLLPALLFVAVVIAALVMIARQAFAVPAKS